MSVIPAVFARVIQDELQSIFAPQAASATVTTDTKGHAEEIGVLVTGVVGHAQFLALMKLAKNTETHLSSKRSGAGQRYFFTAESAK